MDQEGYREARAQDWEARRINGPSFELEGLIGAVSQLGQDSEVSRKVALGGCGTVTLLVLMASSIGSVLPIEYGIVMNSLTRAVDDSGTFYHGGRHLILPWNTFIVYPATAVTVEFTDRAGSGRTSPNPPLHTRTKDGLALNLHISFQYRLQKENLAKLFKLANQAYEPLFIRNSKDVLLKAAADYEAFEYWENREKIGDEFLDILNNRLKTVYAICTGIQILIIDLPPEFEDSIVQTQVQQQAVRTRQNDQQVKRIRADTTVLQADYQRNVTITNQKADSLYYRLQRTAKAEAQQKRLQNEAWTLAHVRNKLGLSPAQMVAYQQYVAYYAMDNASFIYGMKNAMINVQSR